MRKTLHKFNSLLLVGAFISAIFFGSNMGMDMSQNKARSKCIFDQSADCPMGYQEHIDHWQQIFIATRSSDSNIIFLIVFGGAALWVNFFQSRDDPHRANKISKKIGRARDIIVKLFGYISQALSAGILNPKIYHSVSNY